MTARIALPGHPEPLVVERPPWAAGHPAPVSRRVLAAAHVAARPDGSIDWAATGRFREYLWSHGFAVADAMDTAQRGMGLSWPQARELIQRTTGQAAARVARYGSGTGPPGPATLVACGAGTDQLAPGERHRLAAIVKAYEEQIDVVQSAGAQVILMASRALAAAARSGRDYLDVYGHLLGQASEPVILHWLGEAFDPELRGYWGAASFPAAARTVLDLVELAGDRIDGIKLSVLDADAERALRRRLPAGVRLYTGDDFHYAELIKGGPDGHSDALLGAFAAVTAPAAEALQALDTGDEPAYDAIMGATVPLSKKVFAAPTYRYKTSIAFLAWLNGLQPHFAMLDGFERQRPTSHLAEVFELAAAAGALLDPELAVARMGQLLVAAGRRP